MSIASEVTVDEIDELNERCDHGSPFDNKPARLVHLAPYYCGPIRSPRTMPTARKPVVDRPAKHGPTRLGRCRPLYACLPRTMKCRVKVP